MSSSYGTSGSSDSELDLDIAENQLNAYLEMSEVSAEKEEQQKSISGCQDTAAEFGCVRCLMLGAKGCTQNLKKRYCPNCNELMYVCSKHTKTYSPHGLSCASPGQIVCKRPYLRKLRRFLLFRGDTKDQQKHQENEERRQQK